MSTFGGLWAITGEYVIGLEGCAIGLEQCPIGLAQCANRLGILRKSVPIGLA